MVTPNSLWPTVEAKLLAVRQQLRSWIWTDVVARMVLVAGVWFLAGWLLDYGPIWVGGVEMPVPARAAFLFLGFAGLGFVVYRWGWRRVQVSSSDQEVALLLERKFPALGDRLITLVEVHSAVDLEETENQQWHQKILAHASVGVREELGRCPVGDVFDWRPLRRTMAMAGVVIGLLVLWVFVAPWSTWIAWRRLVCLDDRLWPRLNDIQLASVVSRMDPRLEQLLGHTPSLPLDGTPIKFGKGSDLQLIVHASKSRDDQRGQDWKAGRQFPMANLQKKIPTRCLVYYRQDDGTSGRQYFTRFGAVDQSTEGFRFAGPPFQRMMLPIEFSIFGDDDRQGPIRLLPVENSAVVQLQLDCVYPKYLAASSSRWLPQTLEWVAGLSVPNGTSVKLKIQWNKPISRVLMAKATETEIAIDRRLKTPTNYFEIDLGLVEVNSAWQIWTEDVDGVWSPSPMAFDVIAVEDQSPVLEIALDGIDSVVTPDALIPITVKAQDDYGVRTVRAKLTLPVVPLTQEALNIRPGQGMQSDEVEALPGTVSDLPTNESNEADMSQIWQALVQAKGDNYLTTVDLRLWQQQYQKQATLSVDQKQRVQLLVVADDYFDRDGQSHATQGQVINLEVVSPATLLRLLKRSEVGQRKRLEQIYDELIDLRFYLQRCRTLTTTELATKTPATKSPATKALATTEPATKSLGVLPAGEAKAASPKVGESSLSETQSSRDMAMVFVRRANTQNEKSRQELLGVRLAFEKIVLQVINNRLEAAEYRRRLEDRIIKSLSQLAEQTLDQLKEQVAEATSDMVALQNQDLTLEGRQIAESIISGLVVRLDRAMVINEKALEQLNQILQDLTKFESDAELYEVVRQMYDSQKQLLDATKKQQQQQAFDDLFGGSDDE